jgi:hypothetical protein
MSDPYRQAAPRPWLELNECEGHMWVERDVPDRLVFRRAYFCAWCGLEWKGKSLGECSFAATVGNPPGPL